MNFFARFTSDIEQRSHARFTQEFVRFKESERTCTGTKWSNFDYLLKKKRDRKTRNIT